MAITEQDVLDNASAIAQLINGSPADVDINALPEETSWADTDFAHIQKAGVDSKILKSNLDVNDSEAIHDNVADEINQITVKATPVAADKIVIEDSAASWAKKGAALTTLLAKGNILSATKSDNYTILDTDLEGAFYLLGATGNKIFTLPTLADNLDREFLFLNLDTADQLQIKGESAELIFHLGNSQNTIDIELEGSGIKVKARAAGWEVTAIIGAELQDISGTLEMIYTKYFLGTTDADSQTNVTHGISDVDKILPPASSVWTSSSQYWVYGVNDTAGASESYQLIYTSTDIILVTVGANLQSQNYRIKVEYYI